MATYLKAGNIKGNVTARNHDNWILIDCFEFSVRRSITSYVGRSNNRDISAPSLSSIIIHKRVDQASAQLFQQLLKGKAIKEVAIDICHTDKLLNP